MNTIDSALNLARQATTAASVKVIDSTSAHLAERAQLGAELGRVTALAELMRTVVIRCLELAFEKTPIGPDGLGGLPLGMDLTGRLRRPVPWSNRNHVRYGLTHTQRDLLHYLIHHWDHGWWRGETGRILAQVPPAIFLYDPAATRWAINITSYPRLTAARAALAGWPSVEIVAYVERDQSAQRGRERAERAQRAAGQGR